MFKAEMHQRNLTNLQINDFAIYLVVDSGGGATRPLPRDESVKDLNFRTAPKFCRLNVVVRSPSLLRKVGRKGEVTFPRSPIVRSPC